MSQLAKLMGHKHHKNAERAIESFEAQGVITIDGSTETEPAGWKGDYYDDDLDWAEQPLIALPEELQVVELDPITVGELTEDVEQFPTRDLAEIEGLLVGGRDLERAA